MCGSCVIMVTCVACDSDAEAGHSAQAAQAAQLAGTIARDRLANDEPEDLIQGVLSGARKEFDLVPDRSNMTAERVAKDLEEVRRDINTVLRGLEESVSAAGEQELSERPVLAHLKARGRDEERTVDMLLERGFVGHWQEHLKQIGELRALLGFS